MYGWEGRCGTLCVRLARHGGRQGRATGPGPAQQAHLLHPQGSERGACYLEPKKVRIKLCGEGVGPVRHGGGRATGPGPAQQAHLPRSTAEQGYIHLRVSKPRKIKGESEERGDHSPFLGWGGWLSAQVEERGAGGAMQVGGKVERKGASKRVVASITPSRAASRSRHIQSLSWQR